MNHNSYKLEKKSNLGQQNHQKGQIETLHADHSNKKSEDPS